MYLILLWSSLPACLSPAASSPLSAWVAYEAEISSHVPTCQGAAQRNLLMALCLITLSQPAWKVLRGSSGKAVGTGELGGSWLAETGPSKLWSHAAWFRIWDSSLPGCELRVSGPHFPSYGSNNTHMPGSGDSTRHALALNAGPAS